MSTGKLTPSHPIRKALKKSRISKELQDEFCKFLARFEDWEGQALYMLQDKKEKIELIVEEMYGVPLKEQQSWEKSNEELIESNENLEIMNTDIEDVAFDYKPRILFKEWKQEHGFESIPPEIGDVHTFVRFEPVITQDREEKFLWKITRLRYGKRGWGNERLIKNIQTGLLDNNNNPGWVVKNFLEENILLCDEENRPVQDKEIPNPFLLNSRDTHSLLFLMLGHPYLYYQDSESPVGNFFQEIEYELNVYKLNSHRLLAGNFYHIKEKERQEIAAEDFIESGIILQGLPKAIIFDSKYMRIKDNPLPVRMITDSFKGILVPEDQWSEFHEKWRSYYPDFELVEVKEEEKEVPNFSARGIKDWRYWLICPEGQIQLFERRDQRIILNLKQENEALGGNRIRFEIENFNPPANLLSHPQQAPKANQLIDLLIKTKEKQSENQDLILERHSASQLLILAEEYPYILNHEGENIFATEKLIFSITVRTDEEDSNQFILQGSLSKQDSKGKVIPLDHEKENIAAIGVVPSYVLMDGKLHRISNMVSGRLVNDTLIGVVIDRREISDFYATAISYLTDREIPIKDPEGLLRVSALYNYSIQGQITIWEIQGILMGRLNVLMKTDIGEFEYPIDSNSDTFTQKLDNQRYEIHRNPSLEQRLREQIYEHGWVEEGDNEFSMNEKDAMRFVLEILPQEIKYPTGMITYMGMKKLKRWKTRNIVPGFNTSIKSGVDWFDLNIEMTYEGKEINIRKIIELWKQGKKAIELPQNEGVAIIDKEWINKYAPILNRLMESSNNQDGKNLEQTIAEAVAEEENKGTSMKVDHSKMGLINELEQIAEKKEHDKFWENMVKSFSEFKQIRSQKIPPEVKADLRDYQKDGVNWLYFLREYRFGGILADDMGLGKTLQTLTFLAVLKKKKVSKLPNLVIAPTSVVSNWVSEVRKFTPHFKCILLHGQRRKELYEQAKTTDLIVTTYGLLQRDLEFLTSLEYSTVILDEGQMIKNTRSKTANAVSELKSEQRLTLTGTPIENSVSELWSQFNFLMPGFLGTIREFQSNYIKPAQKKNIKKRYDHAMLRRQTKPFILRRMKQQVAKELPPKIEQTLYCEMTPEQQVLYENVVVTIKKQLDDQIKIHGTQGMKIAIFDALLKLRQICCDPRLSTLAGKNPPPSGKLALFAETVSNIVEEGHRVLVFSQFVKMLNLIQETLRKKDIPFLQLDGSTPNRQELVKKFQESDDYPVFLISLKAGGTGINLTAADYVIHYDPWWNPAVEAQATDRVYRIGQKNHVHVYKLITKNSIEEKILDLQTKKMALASKVVETTENFENLIDQDDIKELFSLD